MKTMTCAQMGGMCDQALSAETKDEMLSVGMAHLEEVHPEMAETVKSMPKDDPMMVEWMDRFTADWENTPDNT